MAMPSSPPAMSSSPPLRTSGKRRRRRSRTASMPRRAMSAAACRSHSPPTNAIIRHNQPEVWAFCLGNGYAGLKDALGSNDSRLQSSKLYFTCMSLAGMLLQ
ncbi:hypothetical protein ZEAMMB73_Zm00001d011807 [Zea mays]|uniref:Uncharacterized protein n=1 Tax=Zea mays TaxID=4577 RepID=A0A1D6G3Z8_MAIZE|nr:hypothetical protein ZEAMMB73_Zm00001d011807 [Zea mays]